MDNKWVVAKTVSKMYIANIAIEVLEDNNIKGVIMNKKDSSYQTFGDIEIYVNPNDLEKAQLLLKEID